MRPKSSRSKNSTPNTLPAASSTKVIANSSPRIENMPREKPTSRGQATPTSSEASLTFYVHFCMRKIPTLGAPQLAMSEISPTNKLPTSRRPSN